MSADIYDRYQALAERSNEVRAWAKSRIAHCESVIAETWTVQDSVARRQEKQTLEAVLRILDGKETPWP